MVPGTTRLFRLSLVGVMPKPTRNMSRSNADVHSPEANQGNGPDALEVQASERTILPFNEAVRIEKERSDQLFAGFWRGEEEIDQHDVRVRQIVNALTEEFVVDESGKCSYCSCPPKPPCPNKWCPRFIENGSPDLTGDCEIDCRERCAYPGEFSECDA